MLTFDKLIQRGKSFRRSPAPAPVSHARRNGLLGMLALAGAGYALKRFLTPERRSQLGHKLKNMFARKNIASDESDAFAEGGYTHKASPPPAPVPDIPMRGAY